MFRSPIGLQTESSAWLATPKARLFLQYERRTVQRILPGLPGFRCVQIGSWGNDRCALETAATLCHWQLGFDGSRDADVLFDGRQLPLASHSVDVVLIAHALESVAEPHVLLRECARVLSERGQIVVLAFNPLSFWALRQGLSLKRQPAFKPLRMPPSASRLCDWLRLLELEPDQLWRYGLGAPFFGGAHEMLGAGRWRRCVGWSAQAYAVVARRHVPMRIGDARGWGRKAARPVTGLAHHTSGRVRCRR